MKIEILKDDVSKVFITSDTHYMHKNICRGVSEWKTGDGQRPDSSTRDYQTLEEMNDLIVNNINDVVRQDDILIHGGDWSFGGFENIAKFWNRINCKTIHLCLGNHDDHIRKNKNGYKDLFTSVSDMIMLDFNYHGDKSRIHIQHYPIQSWRDLNQGTIHLHGHTHLSKERKFGRGRKQDVGLDGNNMKPYDLYNDIVVPMKLREIKSDMLFDHHTEEFK